METVNLLSSKTKKYKNRQNLLNSSEAAIVTKSSQSIKSKFEKTGSFYGADKLSLVSNFLPFNTVQNEEAFNQTFR